MEMLTHLPALPSPVPARPVPEVEKGASLTRRGGEMKELSQNLGESNFTSSREPKGGGQEQQPWPGSPRAFPPLPLGGGARRHRWGAEEVAGRRGEQTLPTRL